MRGLRTFITPFFIPPYLKRDREGVYMFEIPLLRLRGARGVMKERPLILR
jgi:hypothetical protein